MLWPFLKNVVTAAYIIILHILHRMIRKRYPHGKQATSKATGNAVNKPEEVSSTPPSTPEQVGAEPAIADTDAVSGPLTESSVTREERVSPEQKDAFASVNLVDEVAPTSTAPAEVVNDDAVANGGGSEIGRPQQGSKSGTVQIGTSPESRRREAAAINRRASKTRRVPIRRGGRPRGKIRTKPPRRVGDAHGRPCITCWQRGQDWVVAVELPEGLLRRHTPSVWQGSTELARDRRFPTRWLLRNIVQPVEIRVPGSRRALDLGNDPWLIFKLGADAAEQGRMVKTISSGEYAVLVPVDWKRDTELAGAEYVAPEHARVGDQPMRMHFFQMGGQDARIIAFRDGRQQPIRLQGLPVSVVLEGNRIGIGVVGEKRVPVFGGSPPALRATGATGWSDVGVIILGEEGPGSGKWRTELRPPSEPSAALILDVAERTRGWYFVRIYDHKDDLIDSFDYQHVLGLHAVAVEPHEAVPGPNGHPPVCVSFVHEEGYTVIPAQEDDPCIELRRELCQTVAVIPTDARYDRTEWHIKHVDNPRLDGKITVAVERLWWAKGQEGQEPEQWSDRVLELRSTDLRAGEGRAIRVRLPSMGWAERAAAGFDEQFRVVDVGRRGPSFLVFPLYVYAGGSAGERVGRHEFTVRLWREGNIHTFVAAELTVSAVCLKCSYSTTDRSEIDDHVIAKHLHEYYHELPYDQLREALGSQINNLPIRIHKCSYCERYFSETNVNNITTAIDQHQKDVHPDQSLRFRVVDRVEEIRQFVLKSLPKRERCTFCNKDFDNITAENKLGHLIQEHQSQLWAIE